MQKQFVFVILIMLLCHPYGIAQKTYTVTGIGDGSLSQIANLNGITLQQLRDWNNKYDDLVKVGDKYYVEDTKNYSETQHPIDSNLDLDERTTEIEDVCFVDSGGAGVQPIVSFDSDQPNKPRPHYWWLWLTGGIVGGVFIWEKWMRKLIIPNKEIQKSHEWNDNTAEMELLKKEIQKLTKEKRQLRNNVKNLEITNEDLLEENIRLEKQIDERYVGDVVEEKPTNNVIQTESHSRSVLYADFIDDGYFSHVTENPDDDSNFELHLKNKKAAIFIVYKPAFPRIVRNPAAFLQGCEKQVLGQTGIVEIKEEGLTQYDADGKWKVINKLNVIIR